MTEQDFTPAPGRGETVVLLVQEMLIEVFGILIPGFCLIVLAAAALAAPVLDLGLELGSVAHAGVFRQFVLQNATVVLVSSLLFSFVVGHLLYRQDPKRPDQRSIVAQWRTISRDGCVRTRINSDDEYPYGHLKEYLEERGFGDLAECVKWEGQDFDVNAQQGGRARTRSKHFINTLKIEIKHRNSRLYFDILRNEAHIRLMSSVWYGARALIFIAVLGLVLGGVDNLIAVWRTGARTVPHFEAVLLPTMIAISAIACMRSIERFFHYQRVREIVYVLQAWRLTTPAS